MTVPEKIRADLREAIGRREGNRTTILRLLLSEIKNTEISRRESLSDDKVIEVISTEVKRHRESIEAYKKGNRDDLVALEENELSILLSSGGFDLLHGKRRMGCYIPLNHRNLI